MLEVEHCNLRFFYPPGNNNFQLRLAMALREDQYYVLPGSGSSTPREWANEDAERAHPAFATPSRYDEQRAQITARKPIEYVGVRAFLYEGFAANFFTCQPPCQP